MKENSVVDVGSELRTAQQELGAMETQESELRAELRPLVEEKVEAEMNGRKLGPQKERRISVLRGKLDEATEIVEARRGRVRQLRLLVASKDIAAAHLKQRELVTEVTRESEKVVQHLRALETIRRRIFEITDTEMTFVRSENFRLGLTGGDRISERLRFSTGNILPPNFLDAESWEADAAKWRTNLLNF